LGNLGDGKITARWIFREQVVRMRVRLWNWLRIVSDGRQLITTASRATVSLSYVSLSLLRSLRHLDLAYLLAISSIYIMHGNFMLTLLYL